MCLRGNFAVYIVLRIYEFVDSAKIFQIEIKLKHRKVCIRTIEISNIVYKIVVRPLLILKYNFIVKSNCEYYILNRVHQVWRTAQHQFNCCSMKLIYARRESICGPHSEKYVCNIRLTLHPKWFHFMRNKIIELSRMSRKLRFKFM